MYVCVYMYMYVFMYVCMYVCEYVCVYVCTCVCVFMYAGMHACACMYVLVCLCVCASVFVCMYARACNCSAPPASFPDIKRTFFLTGMSVVTAATAVKVLCKCLDGVPDAIRIIIPNSCLITRFN
jgi:hypothetical protein